MGQGIREDSIKPWRGDRVGEVCNDFKRIKKFFRRVCKRVVECITLNRVKALSIFRSKIFLKVTCKGGIFFNSIDLGTGLHPNPPTGGSTWAIVATRCDWQKGNRFHIYLISQACEWVYSGRVFPAEEARAGGLVRQVLPPDELIPAARALAREIAENTSAVSIALSRQMMWKLLGADHPMEAHKIDSRAIRATGASADAHEGVASFLEKRKPDFKLGPSKDLPDFYPWWPERKFE